MRGSIPTKEELYRTNLDWLIQDAKNMILDGKDFDAVIDDYQGKRKELENNYATTSQAEIDLLRDMVVAFCGSTTR